MKILNLYSGLGGNRKGWKGDHEVTAVELDKSIVTAYKRNFPDDTIIQGNAHEYLLANYQNFDFIWSSPPCPTHSKARFWRHKTTTPAYPDMKLYQEILYLKHHFKGKWIVENVSPYYDPLIRPTKKIGRHLFWANFKIGNYKAKELKAEKMTIDKFQETIGIDISGLKFEQRKDKIMRNCVLPEIGKFILNEVSGMVEVASSEQKNLF